MNLTDIKYIYAANGCQKIYVKRLAPNDNSKNQIYLGGSFEFLNIFPISSIESFPAGDWKKERFKAAINFSWISTEGRIYPAPQAQLILYPKYPEVRFSGFLLKCENPPSELMTQRIADRLLFLSIASDGRVLGYVDYPDSLIANEFNSLHLSDFLGVFKILDLPQAANNRDKLIASLKRIHQLGWISSKRLDKTSQTLPCSSPNCGGYTLEAELGITPNGYSEPDFLGWEIKQFSVKNFDRLDGAVITLMTPEPNGGLYKTKGASSFIYQYGYDDKLGRGDRINFGGIHKAGVIHEKTQLKLDLIGFDSKEGKIRNTDGMIALVDKRDNIAASWSFSTLLLHWNRKHSQACYVPSMLSINPTRKYRYGNKIILGMGTNFDLFLKQMAIGNIYYDPGIKIEFVSSVNPKMKRRSQFRIRSAHVSSLYSENEIVRLDDMK